MYVEYKSVLSQILDAVVLSFIICEEIRCEERPDPGKKVTIDIGIGNVEERLYAGAASGVLTYGIV